MSILCLFVYIFMLVPRRDEEIQGGKAHGSFCVSREFCQINAKSVQSNVSQLDGGVTKNCREWLSAREASQSNCYFSLLYSLSGNEQRKDEHLSPAHTILTQRLETKAKTDAVNSYRQRRGCTQSNASLFLLWILFSIQSKTLSQGK